MATAIDDFMSLLGSNRDYVLLALAVLVLAEGAIIVLWARRAARLRRRMEDAVAEAERSASTARAAAASATEQSQGIYRVAERIRESDAAEPAAASAERPTYATGRTTVTSPAPAAAPAPTAATLPVLPAEPTPAAPAASTPPALSVMDGQSEYVTPTAQQAAAWVLPEVEASRTAEPTVAPATTDHPPTTLGWSGASVPVEPAADFAVVTDTEALQRFTPPARPAQAAAAEQRQTPAPNGNGDAAWDGSADAAGGWDAAMFGSNTEAVRDDLPGSGEVLLVEDDPTVAKLYRLLLESRGYSVRHAVDGLDGLDLANQLRPDLVLLDIMMPRMNGIAFLQALRSGPMKDVPVVVLSNFMEQQLVDDAMSLGALEYMVKAQTRPEALVGALPHWLRGERAFSF